MKKLFFIFSLCLPVLLTNLQASEHNFIGPRTKSETAKEWLNKNATPEQKHLIVLMRLHDTTNPNQKTFMLKAQSHEERIYKSLPGFVQEYLQEILPSICANIKCVEKKCDCYFKIRPIDLHSYKPTPQEVENFDNEAYWNSRTSYRKK